MSQNMNIKDGTCCSPAISGLRRLKLANGAEVGIIGLDAVMERLYAEGKAADETIVSEMIQRLSKQNYFSPSAIKTYEELLLSEYQSYYAKKAALVKKENESMTTQENNQTKKKGLFGLFKGEKKTNENSCCNMKIVPKEQPVKEAKSSCCNMKIVPKEQVVAEKAEEKGDCDCDSGCCK